MVSKSHKTSQKIQIICLIPIWHCLMSDKRKALLLKMMNQYWERIFYQENFGTTSLIYSNASLTTIALNNLKNLSTSVSTQAKIEVSHILRKVQRKKADKCSPKKFLHISNLNK